MFSGVPPLCAAKSLFPDIDKAHFLACIVTEGIDMLTKRSTHVDQNIRSQSIHSQLSVAKFYTFQNVRNRSEIFKTVSKTLKIT